MQASRKDGTPVEGWEQLSAKLAAASLASSFPLLPRHSVGGLPATVASGLGDEGVGTVALTDARVLAVQVMRA